METPRIDLGPMGCIRCGGPGRLYAFDERARGCLRHECQNGHWGDFEARSVYIPELIKLKLQEMDPSLSDGSVGA